MTVHHARQAARRDALHALQRYQASTTPNATLVRDLLATVAQMVALDTNRDVSFFADGCPITRQPHNRIFKK